MAPLLLAAVLAQAAPQQGTDLDRWMDDHRSELRQLIEHNRQVRALTLDQALIVYDQCLARAASTLKDVPPDAVFGRALAICMPLRVELLQGRPAPWFFEFRDLDIAKRAFFPALTRQLRQRLKEHGLTPGLANSAE